MPTGPSNRSAGENVLKLEAPSHQNISNLKNNSNKSKEPADLFTGNLVRRKEIVLKISRKSYKAKFNILRYTPRRTGITRIH